MGCASWHLATLKQMLLKCCHNLSGAPLIMLILINSHLKQKKGISNTNIEDLGGRRVAVLPIFFRHRKYIHICSESKKICCSYCADLQIIAFYHIKVFFSIIKLIFAGPWFCWKFCFSCNFRSPQILDGEPGTPTCCRKWSPGNNRPPKTPISMCGHQAQGKKTATKSSAEKRLKKFIKMLIFHRRARMYLMCAHAIFCSK